MFSFSHVSLTQATSTSPKRNKSAKSGSFDLTERALTAATLKDRCGWTSVLSGDHLAGVDGAELVRAPWDGSVGGVGDVGGEEGDSDGDLGDDVTKLLLRLGNTEADDKAEQYDSD